jgi:hypothetical protein
MQIDNYGVHGDRIQKQRPVTVWDLASSTLVPDCE